MGWLDSITEPFLDPLGFLSGGDDAKGVAKKNKKGIAGAFDQIYAQQDQGFGMAEQAYQQALQAIQAGFAKGEAAINRTGDAQRQGVQDRLGARTGAISQSLSRSGLYNTTMRQSAELGALGQADREMQEIDQMIAGMLGNLHVQGGIAQGQAFQGLSQMRSNQTNARTNAMQNAAQLTYGAGSPALPPQPSNPLAMVAGALGPFVGLWGGGGGSSGGGGWGPGGYGPQYTGAN